MKIEMDEKKFAVMAWVIWSVVIIGMLGLASCARVEDGAGRDVVTFAPTASATMLVATIPPTTPPSSANADVTYVRAEQQTDGKWTFYVTVSHPDTGWEDYADGWDVVTANGRVVKPDAESPFTRLLLHPHTGEQPFTRSQSRISLPAGVTTVTVRAHDLVDGWGGAEVKVDLDQESGANFEIKR